MDIKQPLRVCSIIMLTGLLGLALLSVISFLVVEAGLSNLPLIKMIALPFFVMFDIFILVPYLGIVLVLIAKYKEELEMTLNLRKIIMLAVVATFIPYIIFVYLSNDKSWTLKTFAMATSIAVMVLSLLPLFTKNWHSKTLLTNALLQFAVPFMLAPLVAGLDLPAIFLLPLLVVIIIDMLCWLSLYTRNEIGLRLAQFFALLSFVLPVLIFPPIIFVIIAAGLLSIIIISIWPIFFGRWLNAY